MPGILSPNVRNLTLGKGFLTWLSDDPGSVAFPLGKVPECTYAPKVTVLPHFAEDLGTRVQDFSVVSQKGGEISFRMEEATARNLALFFLGDVDLTNPDVARVNILSRSDPLSGALNFYSTSDVGPRWFATWTRVIFNPTAAFAFIGDTWGNMQMQGSHVIDDEGLWGNLTLQPDIRSVVPLNIIAPFIDGPLHLGDLPAFAKVGETMTANIGNWVGVSSSFAYQWFANAVLIPGATGKTYVPVSADIGKPLTVEVFGTNPVGTTHVLSGPTMNVHA